MLKPLAQALGVKKVRNFSSAYRMMRNLVKRRLVGRVLHVRPTIWIEIDNDGRPTLKAIRSHPKLLDLLNIGLEVQVGEEIRVYKLASSS